MEQTSFEMLTWHRSIFWKHHSNVSFNICQGASMSWKPGQGISIATHSSRVTTLNVSIMRNSPRYFPRVFQTTNTVVNPWLRALYSINSWPDVKTAGRLLEKHRKVRSYGLCDAAWQIPIGEKVETPCPPWHNGKQDCVTSWLTTIVNTPGYSREGEWGSSQTGSQWLSPTCRWS